MSLRLFIYYCALCGGWAALLGWLLGRILAPEEGIGRPAVQAMLLGITVALALSVVDSLWNLPRWGSAQFVIRVLVGMAIGALAGLIGGLVGQGLFAALGTESDSSTLQEVLRLLGWTLMGLLVGASLGAFDLLSRLSRREDLRGARRKVLNGLLGGGLGGLLGGLLFLVLRNILGGALQREPEELFSSSAWGFVALGACIGLLIGLAQVILKEAWIRVEAGFRAGRELILTKPETTVGRAEGCDIGLFGGSGVERTHARIMQREADYYVTDAQTPGGTYVNEQRISTPTLLRSGDRIRVGNCVLRFQERKPSRRRLVRS